MATTKGGFLANRNSQVADVSAPQKSLSAAFNELIDKEGVRGRIDELMKERAPQFTATMVSMVNADANMKRVYAESPVTIIQSCLRAASLDIPCDNSLGLGYVLPFYNSKTKKMEAQFILGYRGLYNLAMRTGVYERLNVTDIRESELKSFNRLTEDFEIEWLPDKTRNESKIVGYMGHFRMINGMTKTVYMSIEDIEEHEKRHRKGQNRNPVWNSDPEAMSLKTVLKRLIGKWGVVSIEYKTADKSVIVAAESIAKGEFDDEDVVDMPIVDVNTGELVAENVPPTDVDIPFEE